MIHAKLGKLFIAHCSAEPGEASQELRTRALGRLGVHQPHANRVAQLGALWVQLKRLNKARDFILAYKTHCCAARRKADLLHADDLVTTHLQDLARGCLCINAYNQTSTKVKIPYIDRKEPVAAVVGRAAEELLAALLERLSCKCVHI